MQVKIKFLEKESVNKVVHFFNNTHSDQLQNNNRSVAEFEWLFIKSFFKPSLYTTATDTDSGEILGTYAGIFIPMITSNGERILTIKGEDTLLSLDKMIGLGKRDILKELFLAISEKAKEENAIFMWGFTPAKGPFKRCGFKIITQIKGSFYVIRPLKFYENRIEKFPDLPFTGKMRMFIFAWYNWLNISLRRNTSSEFTRNRISFDEIDEEKLLSFLPENVYTTWLSKEFLRWRIEENPSPLNWGFLEFRDRKGKIVAYFIFSSDRQNIFFVEQFLFQRHLPDNKKIQIMKSALDYCRKEGAIMVRAMGLTHNEVNKDEMRLLTTTGFYFFSNPEESYFVFQDLSNSDIKPEDVYLSRLNTQGIR
jgi:hypothetical protein